MLTCLLPVACDHRPAKSHLGPVIHPVTIHPLLLKSKICRDLLMYLVSTRHIKCKTVNIPWAFHLHVMFSQTVSLICDLPVCSCVELDRKEVSLLLLSGVYLGQYYNF